MGDFSAEQKNGIRNIRSVVDYDQEFYRTIRCGTKAQIFRAILQEFFTDSSIQGLKYFCERKRHWSERVFWVVMFVIAIFLSGVMIFNAWEKWEEAPVIVSMSEKATPVWKVPFPAVTICPEIKTSASRLNLTATYHLLKKNNGSTDSFDEYTLKGLNALVQICDSYTFTKFNLGGKYSDASIVETLYNISIKLNDSMGECRWRSDFSSCDHYFRPILTEDGFCFTFNSLNSRDIYTDEVPTDLLSVTGNPNATYWNMEAGYTDSQAGESALNSYPNRVLGTGPDNGLNVQLRLNPMELDYLCQGAVQGFKVVLHAPTEIPQPSKNFLRLPLEQEILVSVKPNMVVTTKELRHYPPNRKLCYLNSERSLKFYKVYTQQHCELECVSNYTLKQCGCVFLTHPRSKDTPICGVARLMCVIKASQDMVKLTFLQHLNGSKTVDSCNCLPSCTTISYDTETSQTNFDYKKLLLAKNDEPSSVNDVLNSNMAFANLNIFFKENEFITSKRSELYGRTDFLASCGGLIGLFIGVTALSFVEFFYYFTLRLVWTLRMYRYGKNEKSPRNSILIASKVAD